MANTHPITVEGQLELDTTPTDITDAAEVTAGRTPTGAIVYAQNRDVSGTGGNDQVYSFGVTDFTDVGQISGSAENFVNPSVCNSSHQQVNVLSVPAAGSSSVNRSATILAIVGGVRLTPLQSGDALIVRVVLVFGSACKAFSAGELSINHGFATAPKAGVYFYNGREDDSSSIYRLSMGFHAGTTALGISMGCNMTVQTDSVSPSDVATLTEPGICGQANISGALTNRIEATVVDDTKVTIEGAQGIIVGHVIGLLIECDDIQTHLSNHAGPVDPDVDFDITSVGFQPQAMLSAMSLVRGFPDSENNQHAGVVGWMGTNPGGEEFCVNWRYQFNNNPTATRSRSRLNREMTTAASDTVFRHRMSNPQFTINGYHYDAVDILDADSSSRFWSELFFEVAPSGPAAPILSNPTDQEDGETTGSGAVDSDTNTGDISFVVTQSATTPSHAQIVAGQDHTGAPADDAGNAAALIGKNSFSFTGLVAATAYFTHFTQLDGSAQESNQVSASGFTTSDVNLPPFVVAPIADQICTIGVPFSLDVSGNFDDPNGDVLTFSAIGLPNGLSISGAGLISGTPTGGFP